MFLNVFSFFYREHRTRFGKFGQIICLNLKVLFTTFYTFLRSFQLLFVIILIIIPLSVLIHTDCILGFAGGTIIGGTNIFRPQTPVSASAAQSNLTMHILCINNIFSPPRTVNMLLSMCHITFTRCITITLKPCRLLNMCR